RAHRSDRRQPLRLGGRRCPRGGARPGDRGAQAPDAPRRMRRARLPVGLGLEGLPGHRRGQRDRAAARPVRVRAPAHPDLHPVDQLVLGDELPTPASSRFWPADSYQVGRPQPSYDKQYVRDWAAGTGWDKAPPAPAIPDDVVAGTRARYVEAYARLAGEPFAA